MLELKELLKAAAELSNAAGRVINNTGLSDLEAKICDLNRMLVIYGRKVTNYEKAKS